MNKKTKRYERPTLATVKLQPGAALLQASGPAGAPHYDYDERGNEQASTT